jgi:hypothetical protein
MAGVSWETHPGVMLILYRGLICSVLEYGCIAFDRMATKLEKIQYRCLRIALGLMQSTQVQTLGVIGGVPPLRLRFSMLNHKYLISAFSTGGHPLRRLLAVLSSLRAQCQRCGGAGTDCCWKGLLPNSGALVGGIGDVGIGLFIVIFY